MTSDDGRLMRLAEGGPDAVEPGDVAWLIDYAARLRADLGEAHAALRERMTESEQSFLSMQECGSDIHGALLAELRRAAAAD